MDQKLLFLINREWTNPLWDRLMALTSSLPAWMPVLVLAGLAALWRGGFRARAFMSPPRLSLRVLRCPLARVGPALRQRVGRCLARGGPALRHSPLR